MCVCVCMYMWKLINDFHITSKLFLSVSDLVSGFLEFQLQLEINKVTIIYVFYLKHHQRQTPSLHFIHFIHFLK